jgi:hypothetical protein
VTGGSSSYYIPASASSYPIVHPSAAAAAGITGGASNMPPNLADESNQSIPRGGNMYQVYSPTYMAGAPQPPADRGSNLGHLANALEGSPMPAPPHPVMATMGFHQHPMSPSPAAYSNTTTTTTTVSTSFPPMNAAAAAAAGGGVMVPLSAAATPGRGVPNVYTPTPWTLGSTDGELALQLALLNQQEMGGVTILGASVPSSPPQTAVAGPNAGSGTRGLGGSGGREQGSVSSASSPKPGTGGGGGGGTGASMASAGSVDGTQSISAAGPDAYYDDPVTILRRNQSLYQERLIQQASPSVESVLAASCEVMGFDIAEVWLRTGPKTHQLTNSHLRPTALEDSVRQDLVDVYYGEKSSERTHRLSPALCKRAKEAGDVVWVSAHTQQGADALRCSISNVRTAVAIPVCHEASNTNITIIFFSIRRYALTHP